MYSLYRLVKNVAPALKKIFEILRNMEKNPLRWAISTMKSTMMKTGMIS